MSQAGQRRVALVVGGSSGIGFEACARFLQQGHQVAVVGRTPEKLAGARERLGNPADLLTIQADVTRGDEVARMTEEVIRRFGRIDILVNCQGGSLGLKSPVEDITEQQWEDMLLQNLTSVFLCCKHVAPHMKRQRWGRIINVSSMAGRSSSFFGSTAYAAAKAGVIGFSRQAALELAPYNVTVNVVAPGVTETDRIRALWAKKSEEERQEFFNKVPLKRLGQPHEAASAIVYLASDDAGYTTGGVIDVNGGYFIG